MADVGLRAPSELVELLKTAQQSKTLPPNLCSLSTSFRMRLACSLTTLPDSHDSFSLLGFCSNKIPTCLILSWCLLFRGPRLTVNYHCQDDDSLLAYWNLDTTGIVTGAQWPPCWAHQQKCSYTGDQDLHLHRRTRSINSTTETTLASTA